MKLAAGRASPAPTISGQWLKLTHYQAFRNG